MLGRIIYEAGAQSRRFAAVKKFEVFDDGLGTVRRYSHKGAETGYSIYFTVIGIIGKGNAAVYRRVNLFYDFDCPRIGNVYAAESLFAAHAGGIRVCTGVSESGVFVRYITHAVKTVESQFVVNLYCFLCGSGVYVEKLECQSEGFTSQTEFIICIEFAISDKADSEFIFRCQPVWRYGTVGFNRVPADAIKLA